MFYIIRQSLLNLVNINQFLCVWSFLKTSILSLWICKTVMTPCINQEFFVFKWQKYNSNLLKQKQGFTGSVQGHTAFRRAESRGLNNLLRNIAFSAAWPILPPLVQWDQLWLGYGIFLVMIKKKNKQTNKYCFVTMGHPFIFFTLQLLIRHLLCAQNGS